MRHGTTRSDQRRRRCGLRDYLVRVGARLFASSDAAARRNGWQVTVRRGGLGRSYRDPRFDQLGRDSTAARDTGSPAHRSMDGVARHGTDRIRRGPAPRGDAGRPPASRPAPSGPGGRRDLPATGTSRFDVGER